MLYDRGSFLEETHMMSDQHILGQLNQVYCNAMYKARLGQIYKLLFMYVFFLHHFEVLCEVEGKRILGCQIAKIGLIKKL